MYRALAIVVLLLQLSAGPAAMGQELGQFDLILSGLRLREQLLVELQGLAVQRVRTIGPARLNLPEPAPEDGAPGVVRRGVNTDDPRTEGQVAMRFMLGRGKERFDVWRLEPTFMTFNGPPLQDVDPALLPDVVQTVANGQTVTSYTSSLRLATIGPQPFRPTVASGSLGERLMLRIMNWTASDLLEQALRQHGMLPAEAVEAAPNVPAVRTARPPALLGPETIGGAACLGVEVVLGGGEAEFPVRFWVEPDHGMAIRRIDIGRPADPVTGARAGRTEYLVHSDTEVSTGLWVADTVVIRRLAETDDGEVTLTHETWSVTQLSIAPQDPAEFELQLPPGTQVADGVGGASGWAYGLSRELVDEVLQAMPPADN